MTLDGWMDHRVVAVPKLSDGIVSDRFGREVAETIRRSVGNSDDA